MQTYLTRGGSELVVSNYEELVSNPAVIRDFLAYAKKSATNPDNDLLITDASDGTISYTSDDWYAGGKYIAHDTSGFYWIINKIDFAKLKRIEKKDEEISIPRHLTIFLANGNTLRFNDVEFIEDDKDEIVGFKHPEGGMSLLSGSSLTFVPISSLTFLYRSGSDARIKTGFFNLNNPNVIGYSIYDQNTEKAQENGGK